MTGPVLKTLKVSEVRPYENNPRRISEEAVAAVQRSIEDYGYAQPVVVDEQHVIIVGHTRFQALQNLGAETIEVYVAKGLTEEQVRAYRLVDNRAGEYSQWDSNALVAELREMDEGILEEYFPDVDLEVEILEGAQVTDDDVGEAAARLGAGVPQADIHATAVECPSCRESFQVKTTSLPWGDQVAG